MVIEWELPQFRGKNIEQLRFHGYSKLSFLHQLTLNNQDPVHCGQTQWEKSVIKLNRDIYHILVVD